MAILAGGFGTRMGGDKASVVIVGKPLLHWVAEIVAPLGNELLVSQRIDQSLPIHPTISWRKVFDRRVDAGPLAGIEALLLAAKHDLVLVVATDLPLVRPELLRFIAGACARVDAAMPLLRGVAQPLIAAYRRSALPVIQGQLDAGDGRVRYIMPKLNGRHLAEDELTIYDPSQESFTNVNRPEDLVRVARILEGRRSGASQ